MTNNINIHAGAYPEVHAGGFSRVDGTILFYIRVQALLPDGGTIVDLGAGRGQAAEAASPYKRSLMTFRPRAHAVGVDVDPVVLENPLMDETYVYDGQTIPLPDASADVIVSDFTFEHVQDPAALAAEIDRVLKPGGWLCARTPYLYSLVVLAASLTPNRKHVAVLSKAQPHRKAMDVFPTVYKLNTLSALKRYFPRDRWSHHSFTWTAEPQYHFGNPIIYSLLRIFQAITRPFAGEALFIYLQKKSR